LVETYDNNLLEETLCVFKAPKSLYLTINKVE